MMYVTAFFVLCAGWYTFSYGLSLWKEDKNQLGSVGAILMALLGTVLPLALLIWKS